MAVALGAAVYLWNAGSGSIEQLMECAAEDDYVTSVAWAADGKHIAVGTSSAAVQIWDAGRSRQVRALRGHSARVSALSWSGTTLSTAGRDTLVLNHDVRCGSHQELTAHYTTRPLCRRETGLLGRLCTIMRHFGC